MTSASPQGGHSPSTAGDEIDERDTAPTATCPHCSATAPDAHYCGACGADLAHGHIDKASRRLHSYAAFPDEPVLRASVVSTLFPQLPANRSPTSEPFCPSSSSSCSPLRWRASNRR